MKTEVIATGSNGNCFLFEESLMIDVGLPFKTINEKVDLSKVTHILLTHKHGDHFKESTIRAIYSRYKHIIFVCGVWLYEKLRITLGLSTESENLNTIKVIEMGTKKPYLFGDFEVWGIHIQKKDKKEKSYNIPSHDAENCGYRLRLNGHKHIHITDTSDLNGIIALNYDTATIECNHCYTTAREIIDNLEDGEFHHIIWAVNNHLCVEKVIAWCRKNGIKSLRPIHIGDTTRDEVIKKLREELS